MAERRLPLLPLRDIIVFPHQVVPLFVGREKSIAALQDAIRTDKEIVLAAQTKAKTNEPGPEDIFTVGTLGSIVQLLHLPDGTVKVIVEGKHRVKVTEFLSLDPFLAVNTVVIEEEAVPPGVDIEALVRSVRTTFDTYVKLNKRIPHETVNAIARLESPGRLADTVVGYLALKLADKQGLLETTSPQTRLEKLHELMQSEIEILQVERKIRTRVKKQMERTQKEYYLNEQMQAIQKELGERDEFKNELGELEEKIAKKDMPKEAQTRAKQELKKLKMMPPMSAEATVVRNYIDWILALPWNETSEDNLDLDHAEEVLDEDHFGLKKPKERIVEYLAVQALVKQLKGPILCLVGPPGVGKTSLAKSVARAMGRKFVRMSLGGVRDEAEIRGHRRTYIGAMPGKLIHSLKRAGTSNPVFLLDEIDKMSADFRGDPSSALLEVLDPEQNSTFADHYLDLDYDLSKVLFIATANTTQGIPLPLQDRMEIIRLAGYTELEKLAIGEKYLVPKQLEANGLDKKSVEVLRSGLETIIRKYTREAGVRSLERELASVCRKVARKVAKKGVPPSPIRMNSARVEKLLGVPKFRWGKSEDESQIGLATGLAWTQVGGDLLMIEVAILPGKGKLIITGKLGDVMQESAQAAMTYVRSRADALGLDRDFYAKADIHIHVPEGAMPKDGPSAGITMAVALTSSLIRVAVRRDVAMTGEITLRGRVLPIGGLKEKVLAAHRAHIERILYPKENMKDLAEIPKSVLSAIEMVPVDHVDEVLAHALEVDDPVAFAAKLKRIARPAITSQTAAELPPPIVS